MNCELIIAMIVSLNSLNFDSAINISHAMTCHPCGSCAFEPGECHSRASDWRGNGQDLTRATCNQNAQEPDEFIRLTGKLTAKARDP